MLTETSALSTTHPMDTSTQPSSLRHESPSLARSSSTAGPLSSSSHRLPPPVLPPASLPLQSQHKLTAATGGDGGAGGGNSTSYSQANPYIATQMYSSSFMSQEGSASIQSLIGIQPSRDDSHTKVKQQQQSATAGRSVVTTQPYQQVLLDRHASVNMIYLVCINPCVQTFLFFYTMYIFLNIFFSMYFLYLFVCIYNAGI